MRRCVACFAVCLAGIAQTPPPAFDASRVLPSGGINPVRLSPGLLISIYGEWLGPVTGCEGHADPHKRETPSPLVPDQMFVNTLIYPKQLCDTQVLVGGIPAGLLYVQERQINFKVPQETGVTGTVDIRVIYKGQSSKAVSLPLGLDQAALSVEGDAAVDMPLWLKVSAPGWHPLVQYPFDVRPAWFKCTDVEVKRDGKLLPRIADFSSQIIGGFVYSGPPCGILSLPGQSHHAGRIPLHLQYRFDRPGLYEIRYTLRRDWSRDSPVRLRSPWLRVEVKPGNRESRKRWLAKMSANAPTDATSLLTDFLPSILGIPDEPSLQLLTRYLYHPDSLVRQYAMYGLTYWPEAEARTTVENLIRTRGPSDVEVDFLTRRPGFDTKETESVVESALPYLRSDSVVLLRGAIAAIYRIALAVKPGIGPALRARAEAALLDTKDHILAMDDARIACDYALALGPAKNDRASAALWDIVHRVPAAAEQAEIALTWRGSPEDLPKLAQLALGPANGDPLNRAPAALPYALHHGYGEKAIPYLETMLAHSEFTWVRTDSARELILAGRPSGFAFVADAIETGKFYRRELIQFVRDQFPLMRNAADPAILQFVKEKAAAK